MKLLIFLLIASPAFSQAVIQFKPSPHAEFSVEELKPAEVQKLAEAKAAMDAAVAAYGNVESEVKKAHGEFSESYMEWSRWVNVEIRGKYALVTKDSISYAQALAGIGIQ